MAANLRVSIKGFSNEIPPPAGYVQIYFAQKGCNWEEAKKFLDHYQKCNWVSVKKVPIVDWKSKANYWIWNLKGRG